MSHNRLMSPNACGGSGSFAIAQGYTELIFRIILTLNFKVAQQVSEKRSVSGAEREELVRALAENGHIHWIRLAQELNNLAIKSIGRKRLPPLPQFFYENCGFELLQQQEQELHKADVKQVRQSLAFMTSSSRRCCSGAALYSTAWLRCLQAFRDAIGEQAEGQTTSRPTLTLEF